MLPVRKERKERERHGEGLEKKHVEKEKDKEEIVRGGGRARWLKKLTAFSEDLSSAPSTM